MSPAPAERAREALSHIPADDRDLWVRMAFAVKEGFGEAGFDLWNTWSQTSDAYNERDALAVWKSADEIGDVKLGSLFHEAIARGYRGETASGHRHAPVNGGARQGATRAEIEARMLADLEREEQAERERARPRSTRSTPTFGCTTAATWAGGRAMPAHAEQSRQGEPGAAVVEQFAHAMRSAPRATPWRDHRVATFAGARDTRRHDGQPYRTVTLGQIFDATAPAKREKQSAPAIVPSSYCEADARGHDVQRERGSFTLLCADIDQGSPTLEQVTAAVDAFVGASTACLVYSSASASEDRRKWRAMVPLAVPIPWAEWADVQHLFFARLEQAIGVRVDWSLQRAAQPVYLPNVPPDRRGEDGAPLFHERRMRDGVGLDVRALSGQIEALREQRQREEEAAQQARAALRAARPAANAQDSVIAAFNGANPIAERLAAYGYQPERTGGDNWRSPHQTSGSYATRDYGTHWVSTSRSDAAAGIGIATQSGHRCGDAFALFAHYEHGGDAKAAASAYREQIGRARRPAGKELVVSDGAAAPDVEGEPDDRALPPAFSEDALADAFSRRYGDDLRYCAPWGKWLRWDGSRWRDDRDIAVFDLARAVCRDVAGRVDIPKLARAITSAKTVAAVERLARSDRRHATLPESFDADLFLLNTPAGTIDLRDGSMRPHRRVDLLTKITGASPDFGAEGGAWRKFLRDITRGDAELEAYLQRLIGYCLTGDTRDHVLAFGHGAGANGKSTLLDLLLYIFGDYAKAIPAETLMETRGDRHPTELASLMGVRLAISSELEEGQHWAESRIKSLTGDATIAARFMRQDFFEYRRTHKHIVAGNHKPSIRVVDEAMRRRIHLVPFAASFKDRPDRDMPAKLQAEAPGVLAWAIRGCLEWQAHGLNPPACVRAATEDYLAGQDTLGQWIEERCDTSDRAAETASGALYADYSLWKEARGERPLSQKQFSGQLESRHPKERRGGIIRFAGIRLADGASGGLGGLSHIHRYARAGDTGQPESPPDPPDEHLRDAGMPAAGGDHVEVIV